MKVSRWSHRLRSALTATVLFLLVTACYATLQPATDATVWVTFGPPAPRYEVQPAPPGPEYYWIVGYSEWNGTAYYWTPGRYERRPSPRARWVKDRWHHEDRGWRRVPGHWDGARDERSRRRGD